MSAPATDKRKPLPAVARVPLSVASRNAIAKFVAELDRPELPRRPS